MNKELFERVKKEINLVEYIASTYSVKVTGGNGSWNINPNPFDMQTNDNFKVSYKNGVWLYNSFNSEEGGTIIDFLQKKEGLYNDELINELNDLLKNENIKKMPVLNIEEEYNIGHINKISKFIDTNEISYFERRGLSKEVINKYKLGTCDSGLALIYSELGMKSHPNMRNHKYMIPCYDEYNNLRFIVARNYQEPLQEGSKKTWNIKGIPTYFLNQFYIEGVDVNKGDIIMITESWGDALSAESINNRIKVVALHSTSNVKKLAEILTINRNKLDGVKFIIAFNNDETKNNGTSPGKLASKKVIKIMNQLEFEYEVFMPSKYNDINEWILDDKENIKKELNIITNRLKYVDKLNLKGDVKDAFFSYIDNNLRYILNSDDDRRYLYWNENVWIRKTEEEARLIYGNFIKECKVQFEKNRKLGKYSSEESAKLNKKIKSWNTTAKVKECLNLIGINEDLTINLSNYKRPYHIHISENGKLIDLKKGAIKDTNKDDVIIDTSKYKLVSKEVAVEFMENNILSTYRHVLDQERLNFLLDFLAFKMMGKNFQLAIINIGPSKCGKSMLKNLTTKLFGSQVAHIPYAYLTTANKGNLGAERDDIIVNLDRKLIALSSEADKDNAPIAVGRFKNILSNSITDARATGGKMQNGVDLTHLDMIIDTNEGPEFSGYDDAINNRLIFVKWENPIPKDKRIDNFIGEVIEPNMDKIWSYFIYRAIDIRNENFAIPSIICKDSSEYKYKLDGFMKNVINKLEYDENEHIDIDIIIRELEVYKYYPEIKTSKSPYKDIADKIGEVYGFEKVYNGRYSSKKINCIKRVKLKSK